MRLRSAGPAHLAGALIIVYHLEDETKRAEEKRKLFKIYNVYLRIQLGRRTPGSTGFAPSDLSRACACNCPRVLTRVLTSTALCNQKPDKRKRPRLASLSSTFLGFLLLLAFSTVCMLNKLLSGAKQQYNSTTVPRITARGQHNKRACVRAARFAQPFNRNRSDAAGGGAKRKCATNCTHTHIHHCVLVSFGSQANALSPPSPGERGV